MSFQDVVNKPQLWLLDKEIEDLKNKAIRCTIKRLKGGVYGHLVKKYYQKF